MFKVCVEFTIIVTKDLLRTFLDGLDAMVSKLLKCYKEAGTSKKVTLNTILQRLQAEVIDWLENILHDDQFILAQFGKTLQKSLLLPSDGCVISLFQDDLVHLTSLFGQ